MKKIILLIIIVGQIYSQNIRNNFFIQPDSIKKHLQFLASDSLEGRGTGSKGEIFASNYIANKFEKIGLKKLPNGTYFQNILLHGSQALENSELYLKNDSEELKLKLIDDYLLFNTNSLNYIPQYRDIVFVGYGIVAPEYDYNDYYELDVENKVVIFLDGEPKSVDPSYFDGDNPTIHSNIELKNRVAFSRGAIATILIPIFSYKNWEYVQNEFNKENISLAHFVNQNLNIIINPTVLDFIFKGAEKNIKNIIDDYINNKIKSFNLKTKLKFKGSFKERTFISRNVIGYIEGSDKKLKDSYIIVSAHYDHLGIGKPVGNDSIYNGALDNAIGVSVMLEIARAIVQNKFLSKRTIIFIATTGEEYGLLGSKFYVENPVFPLYKTVADINIDGVAINRNFEGIIGIGAEFSTLKKTLQNLANDKKICVENIPGEFKKMGEFNLSDQLSFAQAGIPSILIYEGLKNKDKSEDKVIKSFYDYMSKKYHTPFDDLNQDIDYIAAVQHAQFLTDFILKISNSESEPEWFDGVEFNNVRLNNRAEKK
ncbi:M28 family peptidase [Stygiobacter electus]|uniref:M28 family peptidase n=1 Tax=Stygiobacter electus TaxID=3032292 RepID=A0AAE3P2K6_9BACT|nr:M28 family peptidase [Stygiobacter electus]MDF1612924.1 M28 family peptidase [Stygiobacter electus]